MEDWHNLKPKWLKKKLYYRLGCDINEETCTIKKLTREWIAAQNIKEIYDQMGICNVVVPENGHLTSGMYVVGGDSYSPTGGAFGAGWNGCCVKMGSTIWLLQVLLQTAVLP